MFNYKNYGAFKSATRSLLRNRLKQMARKIGFRNRYLRYLDNASKNELLIEIGCGDGSFLNELINDGFKNVLGIEPSDSYQKVVDSDLIIHCWAHEYLLTIQSGSISTVVALDVLEHIPQLELQSLLALLSDRLVPGGKVIFRVPNMAGALGLYNFYGDISHVTGLNEISINQFAYGNDFSKVFIYPEPFSYPTSLKAIFGVMLWVPYRFFISSVMAAYGVSPKVLTPNIICILQKNG